MKTPTIAILLLSLVGSLHGETQLDGAEIFSRVKEKYSTCETFSCVGTSLRTLNTTPARNDERSFLIRFERPDLIRVDWTRSKFLGLGKETSSIYTDDGKIFSYSATLEGPKPYPSVSNAIGVEAGVSDGISYLIPPLLLGESGYLSHWTITRGPDDSVAGTDCYTVSLETKGYGIYTFAVAKRNFSILRATQDSDASVVNAQRERAQKENPAWFKDPPGTPKPSISSKTIVTFRDVTFDLSIPKGEFNFQKES